MNNKVKRKANKETKGITLITLVITIVVLLILAGLSISILSGENGILNQATKAKENTRAGEIKEQISLAVAQNQLVEYTSGTKITKMDLIEQLKLEGRLKENEAKLLETQNVITIGNVTIDFSVLSSEYIIDKELQGKYIYADNVCEKQHDVYVRLSSSSITDFSTIKVKQFGANLFDYTKLDTSGDISLESYENGIITIKNNYSSATKVAEFIFDFLPAGTYTLSRADSTSTLFIYTDKGSGWSAASIWKNDIMTFSSDTAFSLKITTFITAESTVQIKNLQLQFGNEKTDYEEYLYKEFIPNSDGIVEGVKSISPIMTILVDSEDTVINCNYKKIGQEVYISKVKGKKMAVIGDSISAGVSSVKLENGNIVPAASAGSLLTNTNSAWWQLVQEKYEISHVINNSVTGASFSLDGSTKVDGVLQNPRFTTYLNSTSLPQDLDIIMIFGGTNDYSQDRPLGTVYDSASTENNVTFCSAVKATLEYLTTNFPNAEIVYITPIPRWHQTGELLTDENGNYYINGGEEFNERNKVNLLLEDYSNAIKNLCALYSKVQVCDLYSTSGMDMGNMEFKLKYAPDGLHPNADGTKIYVENGIFPFLDKIWLQREIK